MYAKLLSKLKCIYIHTYMHNYLNYIISRGIQNVHVCVYAIRAYFTRIYSFCYCLSSLLAAAYTRPSLQSQTNGQTTDKQSDDFSWLACCCWLCFLSPSPYLYLYLSLAQSFLVAASSARCRFSFRFVFCVVSV